jgi:hypothetical protein
MYRIYIRLVMLAVLLLPLVVSAAEAPAVEEGKGLVVLYRMSKAKGAAIGFNLMSSSGFSGNLSNGSWLFEQVEPGPYTYSVSSPSFDGQDSITVNVTAGQTYCLKGEIKWGWPAGRTKFSLMPESSG